MSRSIVRRLVVATAAALVLGACGGNGGEAESGPETSPAPVRTMTQDELVAVLPTLEDVDEGSTIDETCPVDGEQKCAPRTVGDVEALAATRTLTLPARGKPEDVERQAAGSGITDLLFAGAEQWPDAGTARERFESLSEDDAELEGDFDIPIEDLEDGRYSPGRTGNGSVEEVEVGGRPAQVLDYEATFTFRDGEPEERLEVQVAVLVDQVFVFVTMATSALGRERAELRAEARDLATDIVERLPTTEE